MADAGRVVSGSARGVRLLAPGAGTRPLTDRVKQTLFAVLDPVLADARVLDLFAGSGAGAIEALSRGAARAVLVEHDARAVGVIRANLERASLADRATVVRADVLGWLRTGAVGAGAFDLVLADPPYERPDLLEAVLDRLGAPDAPLTTGAIVVAKHFWRDAPAATVGLLASARARRIGETALTFYRWRSMDTEDIPEA